MNNPGRNGAHRPTKIRQSRFSAILVRLHWHTMSTLLQNKGVGAGNFWGVQKLFCPNFVKFFRKTFIRQTVSLQNVCSCWLPNSCIFLYPTLTDLQIVNLVL